MLSLIKKNYWVLPVTVICLFFSYCGKKEKGAFTVTMHYTNADKMTPIAGGTNNDAAISMNKLKVLLEEIPYGGDMNPVLLDSGSISSKAGTITLKGNGKEEGIYQLVIDNGPSLLLINDEAEITVDIDLSKKDDYYKVSGSPASAGMRNFILQYSEKGYAVNKTFSEIDSLKQFGGSDSLQIISTEKKNKAIANLNSYMKQQLQQSNSAALSLFMLGMASRSLSKAEFEKELNDAGKKFPAHATLAKLKTSYEMQQQQAAAAEQSKASSWLGKPAPDLVLNDVNGKPIAISSFKGKYVLVDFWASWCGPCRQENPNVVKAFNQFKNKNFTILGVSLDKDKDKWTEAIAKDGLTWTHVSDLQYWNSKAVEAFRFEGIPYNILIDPKGIIIAEGLRGSDLEVKLKELLP